MTFSAAYEKNSQTIDVRVTYGPITIVVKEDVGHLRAFHKELGKLLSEPDE